MLRKLFYIIDAMLISAFFLWKQAVPFGSSFKNYQRLLSISGKVSSATVHISGYGKSLLIGLWTRAWFAFDLSEIKWKSWTTDIPTLPGLCPVPCRIYANSSGRKVKHI